MVLIFMQQYLLPCRSLQSEKSLMQKLETTSMSNKEKAKFSRKYSLSLSENSDSSSDSQQTYYHQFQDKTNDKNIVPLNNNAIQYDWNNRWLDPFQYFHILNNIEAYCEKYKFQKYQSMVDIISILNQPVNGTILFIKQIEGDLKNTSLRKQTLNTSIHYWKKIGFNYLAPNHNPIIKKTYYGAYIKGQRYKIFDFKIHVVRLSDNYLKLQSENSQYFLFHIRQIETINNIKQMKKEQLISSSQRLLSKKDKPMKIQPELTSNQVNIGSFNPKLLYKKFQEIFIKTQIHFFQFNNFNNEQFKISLTNLEDVDIIFINSSAQQVKQWFKHQWMQIYNFLHQSHNANQVSCHKQLSISQHICLFALALQKFVQKRKRYQFALWSKEKFTLIQLLIQLVLKYCVQKTKNQDVKIRSNNSNSVSKFLETIRNLLFRYLESFKYIDLGEVQVKNELNDY